MAVNYQNRPFADQWQWAAPNYAFNPGTPLAAGFTPTQPQAPAETTATGAGTSTSARSMWANAARNNEAPPNQWQSFPGMSPGMQQPIYNMWDPATYKDVWDTSSRYLQSWYFPQQQAMQNAYQWAQEYDEAMRRWDETFRQQGALNDFQIALQQRQQQAAEWEQGEAARQWAEQFGWTQTTDEWTRELALQELAQREVLQQMQSAAALEQARMSAYGRAETPNVRFRRNWS